MKLVIDNRDLQYSVGTYVLFNGENALEAEMDWYQEEYDLSNEETRTIMFDYDHKGIVADLADESVTLLQNIFTGSDGDRIIKNITLQKTKSPQWYNYTTDSYTAEWDVDTIKLGEYVDANRQAYEKFIADEWSGEMDNLDGDEELKITTEIDFYTRNTFSVDEYNERMWEREHEIYSQHMTLDDESQQLINEKIKERNAKSNQ